MDKANALRAPRRPRVLMLTHRFPFPPDRGDRIRAYHVLKFLMEHFDLTLACTTHEPIAAGDLAHLRELVSGLLVAPIGKWTKYRRAAQSVATGASLTEGYFRSPSLARSIRTLHTQTPFDALLVYCSSMYQYRTLAGLRNVPTIVDLVDVDSQKWRQLASGTLGLRSKIYRLETQRVCQLEKSIATTAYSVALTSPQEVQLFSSTVGEQIVAHGISNGVDTNYFCAQNSAQLCEQLPINLIFTGVMDYPPNIQGMVWFCRDIWPQIVSSLPARLKIVGRRPSASVRELANLDGVEVVGEVPDVRPYLAAADIAISPLMLARGIQNKVLEAMASGLATVVTPQSAEGIDAESGVHFQIAATAHEFAMAVIALARSRTTRLSMGLAARELIERSYGWPQRVAKFRELLDEACSPPPATIVNS